MSTGTSDSELDEGACPGVFILSLSIFCGNLTNALSRKKNAQLQEEKIKMGKMTMMMMKFSGPKLIKINKDKIVQRVLM